MNKLNFTKEELYWIERTADIESSMVINKLINLAQTDISKLGKKETETLIQMGSELIELHNFLKELRIKLELIRNE